MLNFKKIKGGEALKQFALADLKRMQDMSLEDKVARTKLLIKEWHEYFNGEVYVSFSGGKDSTVLLHIARQLYPNIQAVFWDTGLEYPEIREFVKTWDNVEWVKPKKNFRQVILEYGYPVASKETSGKIRDVRSGSVVLQKLRLEGIGRDGKASPMSMLPKKWRYLLEAPFKISDRCCYHLKKSLAHHYTTRTKLKPIIATTTEESLMRQSVWIRHGCNAFSAKFPASTPLSFWREQDILEYIKANNVPIAKIYGDVIGDKGSLKCSGASRTGCMFCLYGVQYEAEPNRFQRMKETHPKQYAWCMKDVEQGGLGLDRVLNYMNIPH